MYQQYFVKYVPLGTNTRLSVHAHLFRIVYDQLSKDPNSLANLDQDLPNYAQHNIPIFSLPQEWLWCESWCGNATKSKVGCEAGLGGGRVGRGGGQSKWVTRGTVAVEDGCGASCGAATQPSQR